MGTLRRRLSAIASRHTTAHPDTPTDHTPVRRLIARYARNRGTAKKKGAVFRTFDLRGRLTANRLHPGDVARILRRRAAAAGIGGDFAGHSLRRGFITSAVKRRRCDQIPQGNLF